MRGKLYYTPTHDWIRVQGSQVTIGLSKAFQKELEEVVYIAFPRLGQQLHKGGDAVILESTKAAMDVLSPLDGKVIAIHDNLREDPSLLKTSEEEEGWFFEMEVEDLSPLEEYFSPEEYQQYINRTLWNCNIVPQTIQ